MNIKENFTTNLNKIFKDSKLTQVEFAKILDTDQGTLHKYLKGKSLPGVLVAYKLCKHYNLNFLRLFEDDKQRKE